MTRVALLVLLLACGAASTYAQQRQSQRGQRDSERVYKARIVPHWFQNTRFWYRNNLPGGAQEFVLVDAERGTRVAAFDHTKLAAGLSKAVGATNYSGDRLPFTLIQFASDGKVVLFRIDDTSWKCDLASYECSKTEVKFEVAPEPDDTPSPRRRQRSNDSSDRSSDKSPDGKWTAFVKDDNVFIRSQGDSRKLQLSRDGKEGQAYTRWTWSPDSKTLVAFRTEPGDRKEVYLVESSPKEGGRAKLQTRSYDLPGDKFPTYEINLFDVATQKQIKPEVDRFEHGWLRPRLYWGQDKRRLTYQQTDRGHQRLRVIEVDAQTGNTRNIIDEKSETFIWTTHTEGLGLSLVNWLEKTDEIIYVS